MIEKFMDFSPIADSSAWIHESAVIMGKVKIGAKASIWPGAVLRGDVETIEIGDETNVQDLSVLHGNFNMPVKLGRGITVGHGAVIHGSKIGDLSLIGMGAIVIDSAIGAHCLIGAGALIPPGSVIPERSLVMGVPGKIVRKLKDSEIDALIKSKDEYCKLAKAYEK